MDLLAVGIECEQSSTSSQINFEFGFDISIADEIDILTLYSGIEVIESSLDNKIHWCERFY